MHQQALYGTFGAYSWMFIKAIATVSISIAIQTFGISYIYRQLMSKWYFSSKFWLICQEFMHVPHIIQYAQINLLQWTFDFKKTMQVKSKISNNLIKTILSSDTLQSSALLHVMKFVHFLQQKSSFAHEIVCSVLLVCIAEISCSIESQPEVSVTSVHYQYCSVRWSMFFQ